MNALPLPSEASPEDSSDAFAAVPPVMHIGEVAARAELSQRSLRHWDDVGLLRPSGRTDGGFRLYTEADLEKILVIRRMKPLGFSLDEMSAAMRDLETVRDADAKAQPRGQARDRLTALVADATSRRRDLEVQLGMADEFIAQLSRQLD